MVYGVFFRLDQRALTALRADSERSLADRFFAVAWPPFRPRATAAGSFDFTSSRLVRAAAYVNKRFVKGSGVTLSHGCQNEGYKQRRRYLLVLSVDQAGHRKKHPGECASHNEENKDSERFADGIVAYEAVSASHGEVPLFPELPPDKCWAVAQILSWEVA
jgi:hypothetical protein